MACFLPKFILLKSNKGDRYLRYRKEDDSKHAFLQFSGVEKQEKVETQYIKFEVQQSETMEGFVHIRSCYNNKYWVRKFGEDESKSWIAAEANEPEEDSTKLSCTLFKPVLVDADVEQEGEFVVVEHDKPQKIRLVHVDQTGQQGCVAPAGSDLLVPQVGGTEGDVDDVFTAYNAALLVVLPDYVALTNHMGQYGSPTTVSGVTYVDFNTSDIGREGVTLQLAQFINGNPPHSLIMVQVVPHRWWHLIGNNNVVQVLANGPIFPLSLIPIRLGGNNVALQVRDQFPNRFATCVRASSRLEHVLACSASSINENAIFGVHEPVLLRKVSNVVYNLADGRVYNISSLDKFKDVRRNNTSVEQKGTISVVYTTSQTTTWSDSVSITSSISASMSVSIPYVGVGFGIEMSEETNQTVVFGKEELDERVVSYQQDVTIPPGKKVTVVVIATRAQCDVPFTCQVTDTLSNGTIRNYTKFDGLFTGANEFGFDTDIIEEDL